MLFRYLCPKPACMHADQRYTLRQLIGQYLRFRSRALNAYGLHSPFVFGLYTRVLRKKCRDEAFLRIRSFHRRFARNREILHYHELRPDGVFLRELPIGSAIRKFGVPESKAGLLFRLARHFKPATILELGTSVGISSMYLAAACPDSRLITLEACPESAAIARQHHQAAGIQNAEVIRAAFEESLPVVLQEMPRIDFVYLDGNHRYEPTLRYFRMIKECLHENSVVVLDDIRYSEGMQRAWEAICRDEQTCPTLELRNLGIVFFRTGMVKQHFLLRT